MYIHAKFHVSCHFGFHYNALFGLITISNTRSKRVNKNTQNLVRKTGVILVIIILIFHSFAMFFIFLLNSRILITETSTNLKICRYTYFIPGMCTILSYFADFFSISICFQHVLYFDVGKSQIEWNMKVKVKFQFTGLMLNDHSNPYIESTTVPTRYYVV